MKSSIKTIFYNSKKGYLLVMLFGLIAGLAVAFFSEFPADGLWAFSYFSSRSLGFWMFTTSVIVLFSEKRLTASINAGMYVGLMFVITGIYKAVRDYVSDIANYENISEFISFSGYSGMTEYIIKTILEIILYGFVPGIVCGLLAAVLWNGRKNNWFGKIMLIMPVCFIVFEAVSMYISVFTKHTMLFMALIDTACIITYVILFWKTIITKLQTNIEL